MKKKLISGLLLLLFVLTICSGCTAADKDISSPENIRLTIEDAKKVVEDATPNNDITFHVENDGSLTFNDREYYRFQIYTLSEQPLEGDQGLYHQQFTYAWACVDVETGQLYELNTAHDALLEWTKG